MPRSTTWFTASMMALALTLPLSACGSDSPSDPPPAASPDEVTVGNDFFSPTTVTVDPGTTVTWTWVNTGGVTHNVTWVSAELSNSPTQASGSHQVAMPSDPGDYDYYCTLHGTPSAGMRGTVRVQ